MLHLNVALVTEQHHFYFMFFLFQIMGQVCNKESDGSESCSEQTSAPDGGVTHAPSHLDDPSELSFTGQIVYPLCLTALKLTGTQQLRHMYHFCRTSYSSM